MTTSLTQIEQLQTWYLMQCNDDWEHSFGVKIENVDNPGWLVTIDLDDTDWAELVVKLQITERSSTDWVHHEVTDQKFVGCGGPGNLVEILQIFFSLVGAPIGAAPAS